MSYVTETVDQELQLDKRLSPKLCFYVDTEKIMSSINAMQLLQMKGRSLVVLCGGVTKIAQANSRCHPIFPE